MLKKLYGFLYLKAFISIVIGNSKTIVDVEMFNSKGLVSSQQKDFDTNYLSLSMFEYISSFTKETPFFYIAILDNSMSQGVIPTCGKQKVSYFYDVSGSEYKCFNDTWMFYTAKSDVYEIEKVYEKIGVDFIFSPFVVIGYFFKDKIESNLALFILVQEDSITLSVFNNSELLYGKYADINIESHEEELLDDEEIEEVDFEEEDSIELDDLDSIDDIDELDDFGDIEDLDSMEDIDEFSESKDLEEDIAESPRDDVSGMNGDYQRFVSIQSSVNDFYQDEKYKSDFVENIYIADCIGLSSELKKYLEEEMFLNVYIREIDLAKEVCSLAKMEIL